jgi:hypothetical protein
MFCYETTRISVRTGQDSSAGFDPSRCDAVKCYLDHYKNLLFLDFMSKNGTIAERAQADAEIEICKRKMKFWERQPHFIHHEAVRQKDRLHKMNRHQ